MSNTLYTDAMREKGLADATDLQQRSGKMDGTALYAEENKIPEFAAAVKTKNMLERPVGFVCRSSAGRVVKLLQKYDSTIYQGEPETLAAQWGFVWSKDPAKALPFVAISTSPYMVGDCCTDNGKVWRSKIDNNVHAPSAYPAGWQDVATEGGTDPTPQPEPSPQVPEFKQPTGAHDSYKKGDRVRFEGKVYESAIDNNAYSPATYPQGWREVTA